MKAQGWWITKQKSVSDTGPCLSPSHLSANRNVSFMVNFLESWLICPMSRLVRNENCVPVVWKKLICLRYFPMLGRMEEGFEACYAKAERVFGWRCLSVSQNNPILNCNPHLWYSFCSFSAITLSVSDILPTYLLIIVHLLFDDRKLSAWNGAWHIVHAK